MLRPIRLFLAGLVLFVFTAGAGVLVASRWGPERTRAVVEISLGETLGQPVQVRYARLYFGGGPLSWMRGVLLDAGGIRSLPQDPDAEPELRVRRLQAELDPVALITGRVTVRSVALDGVEAWVGGGPTGFGAQKTLTLPAADDDAEPLVGVLESLAEASARLLAGPASGREVSLARADLRLRGPARAEGEGPWVLHLQDVSGRGQLRAPGHRATISLEGRLADAGEGARVTLELERDAQGALRAEVDADRVDLAYVAPALAAALPTARLAGTGEIHVRAGRPQPGVFHLSARAAGRDCSGALPRMGDGHSVPVEVARFDVGLDARLDPERLRVTRAFVSAEGSEIELAGEIERPLRRDSHTIGHFGLDRYDLSRRADLIAFLPPRQIRAVRSALEPLRSGRIEDLRVEGHARLDEWLRAFDDDARGLVPDTVTAKARFADFAVRAGEGETLKDLSGEVLWSGDRLELRQVRGQRAGRALPVLDASLDGVSHLAANAGLPEIPDAEEAPVMLGLGPMYDIVVDPNRPPGEMPEALLLALDHVVHPTLVWPLQNLFARVNPSVDGIRLLLEHAVWGKVPVRAEGVWAMQTTGPRRVERVALRIALKPPLEGLAPVDLEDGIWARGRWHLDAHNLGDWKVTASTGAFEAEAEEVRLTSYDLDLGLAGHALGDAVIDFSGGEELPYRTAVRMVGAQAQGVVDKIGFEPHEATGTVTMEGDLHGELRPGRRVMAGMEGTVHVNAQDGAILRRLPALLAIAKVTDTFNPFGSRDEVRYSEIDARLRIDRGDVHAEELRITGRDLRVLATGKVDAVDPEHPVEAVVGVFFFKALDRVIGVVPVLSDLILGEDENLMGAYVQLTGPWESPDAGLVPLKTVASGPASFAMEGVPRFVRRAITALQGAFSRPAVAAPPPEADGES